MSFKFCLITILCFGYVAGNRPNIIFILADDYGWNDIGYHQSEIRTPILDKLASEGVKLENHYVQQSCTPTRSALLSGRMPIHTGMHYIFKPYHRICHPLEDTFLSEKLRELGYATHIVGKWHLGFYTEKCTPVYRGFDTSFGFLGGSEDYYTHTQAGFLDFYSQTSQTNFMPERNYSGLYSTQVFVQRSQDLIKHHNATSAQKPLFLYLSLQSVHLPLQVPQRYTRQYRHIVDKNRRTYAAMVTCMDEGIGHITQTLKEQGMWNNTILVFISDNGGANGNRGGSNWPLRGAKGSFSEGGIRVNAFVHSPILKHSKRIIRDLFHVTDWFPTLIRAAGGSTEALDIDGINQWETLRDGVKSSRKEILHDIRIPPEGVSDWSDTNCHNPNIAVIRMGKWKLLTGTKAASERRYARPSANMSMAYYKDRNWPKEQKLWLYNIDLDPNENHDLSQNNSAIVSKMLNRLNYYKASTLPCVIYPSDTCADPKCTGSDIWKPWVEGKSWHLTTHARPEIGVVEGRSIYLNSMSKLVIIFATCFILASFRVLRPGSASICLKHLTYSKQIKS